MSKSSPPEFDQYAGRYEADLQRSIPPAIADDRYFAEYKIRHVTRRIGGRASGKILDFGCGVGRSLGLLSEHFPRMELWGYDLSEQSIELARQRAPKARLTSNLTDLPEAAFDVIFAANVFHHIPAAERTGSLSRCKSLLRNGGRMFLFEHNPVNPVTRLIFERCPYDRGAEMLRRREALLLAQSVGMRVLRARYTLFFPRQVGFLRPIERLLGWLPLGAQYCVEMAK